MGVILMINIDQWLAMTSGSSDAAYFEAAQYNDSADN